MGQPYIFSEGFRELLTDCEKGLHNYEVRETGTVKFKRREANPMNGSDRIIVTYSAERTNYTCEDCGKQRFEDENIQEISRRKVILGLF